MGATLSTVKKAEGSNVLNLSETIEKYTEVSNPIVCRNVAVIRNSVNCNIKGGSQMCAAEGALEVLREPVISKKIRNVSKEKSFRHTRNSFLNLKQLVDHTIKGISDPQKRINETIREGAFLLDTPSGTRDVSESIAGNTSYNAMLRMETKCNQAVHALNKATIDGTICSKDEYMDHISNFGNQRSGVVALAQCAMGEGGWKNVVGDVHSAEDDVADALVQLSREWVPKGLEPFMAIFYACFASSMILTIGWSASAHKSPISPLLKLFTLIAVVASLYVWPGRMAIRHGMAPYSDPITRTKIGGKWVCDIPGIEDVFIKPLGRSTLDERSGELTHGGYTGCGIYSGDCNDPDLKDDLKRWTEINNACLKFPVGTIKSCDAKSLFEGVVSSSSVPQCKRCDGKYGLYDKEVDCEQVGDIPIDKYGGFGTMFLSDGVTKTITCPEGDSSCVSDRIEYSKISPGECIAGEYHDQKREVVKLHKKCMDIKNKAKEPSDTVGEMCPPAPEDYLKCDSSGECFYQSGSTPQQCSNNLDGCANIGYKQDKFYLDLIDARCKTAEALSNQEINTATTITIVVYGLMVPVLVAMFVWRWFRNERIQPVPWPVFLTSMLLVIPMIVVLVPPYGMVQVNNGMGIYQQGWLPFGAEGGFDFAEMGILMTICLFVVLVFVPLVYIRGGLKKKR